MAIQMNRAFNSRMATKVTLYKQAAGSYDDNNKWIDGAVKVNTAYVVIKDDPEGESILNENGGVRTSDYRRISFPIKRVNIETSDKIGYQGKYFNVLRSKKNDTFGIRRMLIEESENWTPQ
jgi:hypothetical protein